MISGNQPIKGNRIIVQSKSIRETSTSAVAAYTNRPTKTNGRASSATIYKEEGVI